MIKQSKKLKMENQPTKLQKTTIFLAALCILGLKDHHLNLVEEDIVDIMIGLASLGRPVDAGELRVMTEGYLS